MPNESKYEIWKSSQNNQWYWRFRAGNGEIVAGGEAYVNRDDCAHAIGLLMASADCEVYDITAVRPH